MASVMQGERNWRSFVKRKKKKKKKKRNIFSTTQWYCQADKAWLIVGLLACLCACVCVCESVLTIFRCGVAVGVGVVGVGEVCIFNTSWNKKTTDSLSAYSSQCTVVCGQWANISACVCVCVCVSARVCAASCCSHGCVLLISHLCGQ